MIEVAMPEQPQASSSVTTQLSRMLRPTPPYGFRDGGAGEAGLPGVLDDLPGELAALVEFAGDGLDLGFGEFAGGVLEEELFFAEGEFHGGAPRVG